MAPLSGTHTKSTTVIMLRGCSVELQDSSKVGIQDTIVFLICLMSWIDPFFSQMRQECRLILFYKIINGLAQVPFEGVLIEAYKDTRRKHNIKFRHIGYMTSQYYRPISLLCHTYKLFERMMLNRLNLHIDQELIKQQAGFRSGKSTTGQLLNLTQHIEDGYEQGTITGAVFIDLSAAYDTVNHKLLLNKIFSMTRDTMFTDLIGKMLHNRRFYVELNGQKSRWRN